MREVNYVASKKNISKYTKQSSQRKLKLFFKYSVGIDYKEYAKTFVRRHRMRDPSCIRKETEDKRAKRRLLPGLKKKNWASITPVI